MEEKVNKYNEKNCLNKKGSLSEDWKQPSLQDRVFDTNGVMTAITTGFRLSILEKQTITTKGKKQDVASTILSGYERTNMSGFNADNAVLERFHGQAIETLENNDCEVGDTINAYNQKVEKSGISPTITTRPDGFKTAILPVVEDARIKKVGQISSDGSQCGTVIDEDGLCSTLSAGTHGYANNHIVSQYRIRKLTPRECGRLMDVSDEDITKMQEVNSNSQLYKQFGNSIVVNVMCEMFKNLNLQQGD